jgi:hypothetical protein
MAANDNDRRWVESELSNMRTAHEEALDLEERGELSRLELCLQIGGFLGQLDSDDNLTKAFDAVAKERHAHGDFRVTRLADLVTRDRKDEPTISRERRAEYAAVASWFYEFTDDTQSEEECLEQARKVGNLAAIADKYRNWAEEHGGAA